MNGPLLDRRQLLKAAAGAAAAALPLGALACREAPTPNALVVGGLPVTCNLTARRRVARHQSAAVGQAGAKFSFTYSKYSGWPEIKESLMAGRIQAGYMLAPLVMDLADKGIPVKIVSLGHRSGAVIMVRTESPYHHFQELKGKRIAIPSRFAVDFLFLRKMLAQESMKVEELEIVEMPPPDMPAALYANAVDAYCTGEPFGAAAQPPATRGHSHDARRVAELHLLRAHRARGADRRQPPARTGPRRSRPRCRHVADQQKGTATRPWRSLREELLQPGQEDPEVRHGKSDRPRHVPRSPDDPGGIRGTHAAVHEAGTLKDPIAYEKYVEEVDHQAAIEHGEIVLVCREHDRLTGDCRIRSARHRSW